MDGQRFDAISRALAAGFGRRRVLAAMLGVVGVAVLRSPVPAAAGEGHKAAGAKCRQHAQCASGLCEATTGTCVAPCAVVDEPCGAGGICQPIGPGGSGNACILLPADRNCAGYTPCTWNDRAKEPADQLACPHQPGAVCLVTGLCAGPEEVCVPLSPPA